MEVRDSVNVKWDPLNGDPGTPLYRDPGPHSTGNMGTQGPQKHRENGDPPVKIWSGAGGVPGASASLPGEPAVAGVSDVGTVGVGSTLGVASVLRVGTLTGRSALFNLARTHRTFS